MENSKGFFNICLTGKAPDWSPKPHWLCSIQRGRAKVYRMICCKKCDNIFIPKKGLINYCSLKCRNSRQWLDVDKLKKSDSAKGSIKIKQIAIDPIINEKRSIKQKEIWRNKSNEDKKVIIDRINAKGIKTGCRKNTKGHKFSQQTKDKLSKIRKEFYLRFPEKHPNRICAGIKESYPERMTREYFELKGLIKDRDFVQQYKQDRYFVDFYIPKLNLGIEIDGERWHTNSHKELIREDKLKEKINLVRFKALEITKKLVESKLDEIIKNAGLA